VALETVDQLAGRYEVQPDPGLEKSLLEGAADRLTMSEEGFALFVYRKDKLDSKLVKCHLARRTEPGHHGHGLDNLVSDPKVRTGNQLGARSFGVNGDVFHVGFRAL